MAFSIRSSGISDIPALKTIWHTVFGDDIRNIDEFFQRFYTSDMAIVAEVSGEIAASGYLIPLGSAVSPDGSSVPCHVTYALGTLPEFRGLGCAAAITREAIRRCSGSSLSLICPAEDSLFDYYSQKAGYSDFFYAQKTEFSSSDTASQSYFGHVSPLSARDYSTLRETLLCGRFHIRFSDDALRYQRFLCGEAGGFFSITVSDRLFCAAVENDGDGHIYVKEFLSPDKDEGLAALEALCAFLGTGHCRVRSPAAETGKTGAARFAMLIPDETVCPLFAGEPEVDKRGGSITVLPPWFGFSFD